MLVSLKDGEIDKINKTLATGTVLSSEENDGIMTQRPIAVEKSHEINKGYTFCYMITIGIGMFQFGKLTLKQGMT
jgi:hypothetical protein